ncbi:MAG TPA: VOC family protein [Magnetovibrio sp.]
MNARPKPFNGLRHLAIEVPKFEECLAFYTEILGMKILRRASDNLIYLGCGSDVLSLGRLRGEDKGVGGYVDHYGFVADTKEDLEDWFKFLTAKGVNVLDVPHDHSDGARSFHITDPVGNVIQPIYHPAISGQRFSNPED